MTYSSISINVYYAEGRVHPGIDVVPLNHLCKMFNRVLPKHCLVTLDNSPDEILSAHLPHTSAPDGRPGEGPLSGATAEPMIHVMDAQKRLS